VQEIFIDLWRSADRFDPLVAEEITFVAMIARRRVIDRLRRCAGQPESASIDEVGAVPDSSSDGRVGRRLELGEEARLADEHLAQLKPEEQRILRLSIYNSLSHAAIAEYTGLPLGTVKSHIRRGLDSLRQKLVGRARNDRNASSRGRMKPETAAERSTR